VTAYLTNALFREPDWVATYTYKHFLYICLLKNPAAYVRLLIWQGSTSDERRPLSYLITAPGAGDQRLTSAHRALHTSNMIKDITNITTFLAMSIEGMTVERRGQRHTPIIFAIRYTL